jgi:predicted DNA-binding transcriptional regulator AlpA
VTPAELVDWLQAEAAIAEDMSATAPVALVLRSLLPRIRGLRLESNGNGEEPDRLLRAGQVAERLAISIRTAYANANGWPFTRRLPGGSVRFSEKGLERWLSRR